MASSSRSSTSLYINTMVFTIIAGVLSAVLAIVLWMGNSKVHSFAPIIVTLEIGLLAVIITSVVRVIKFERKLSAQQQNVLDNAVAVRSCPDYWVMKESGNGNHTCTNSYTTPDGTTTWQFQGKTSKLNLKDFDGKNAATVCKKVAQQQSPWTDVRVACDAYDISTAPI